MTVDSGAAHQGKAIKSGPLAVEECNYMKQCEVRNNMVHHVKRVSSAKSRVDCGPPKSLQLSQKKRDAAARSKTVLSSRISSRPGTVNSARYYGEYVSYPTGVHSPTFYDDFAPPRASTQNRNFHEPNLLRSSYDPLDYHQHYFTQPTRPFTPRINSSLEGATSALKHFKDAYDYEPPEQRPQHSSANAHSRRRNRTVESVRVSRDRSMSPNRARAVSPQSPVPMLNIRGVDEEGDASHQYTIYWKDRLEQSKRDRELKQRLIKQSDAILDEVRHSHDLELSRQDQENQYLEFVREVTADIIRRNISADSVIKQVFESHIERNKHQLDEAKMREHLNRVSRQLGLVETGSVIALSAGTSG